MFRQLYSFIIAFTCILLSGCSSPSQELKTAERLLEDKPDSALLILQQISPEKRQSDKAKALYNLLYIRALDKKHLPLKPDSLLDYSIAYYEKHPEGNRLAYAFLLEGRKFFYESKYEKAVTSFLKSRDEVKDTTDYLLMGRISADVGLVSHMQKEEKYSIEKYIEAVRYFKQGNHLDQYFNAMIKIGRSYTFNKDLKSSLQYLRKISELDPDSMKKGDLFEELGFAFYNNNNLDSALYYYRKAIKYPFNSFNRPIRYMDIANAYFDSRKFDSAQYYASNTFKYKPELRTQRECYRILANIDYITGDKQALLFHMDQYVNLGDSLRKIDAQTKGIFIEELHKTTKEAKSAKSHILMLSLAILTIFIVFILIYLIAKQRHKKVQSEMVKKHELDKARNKQQIREELINEFHERVALSKFNQAERWKKSPAAERQMLLKELYNDLLHVDDWTKFNSQMKHFFGDLILQLQTEYPTLTQKEIMWCCLQLLDIPQPDMLTLIEYSQPSYSKLKQRLAKKLNLVDATGLSDFLDRKLSDI